uniref:Ashwin n=1 Tax=Echinostoma caproni TaxID=27848 RepID=A0A183AXM2_9TREM
LQHYVKLRRSGLSAFSALAESKRFEELNSVENPLSVNKTTGSKPERKATGGTPKLCRSRPRKRGGQKERSEEAKSSRILGPGHPRLSLVRLFSSVPTDAFTLIPKLNK